MLQNIRTIILFIFFFTGVTGCKKFVEVGPPKTELVSSTVFSDDASAQSAVDGIYSRMISSNGFASGGNYSITLLCGLSSDELKNYSQTADYIEFYTNSLKPANNTLTSFLWNEPYQYIYDANAVIEELASSSGVSAGMKNELKGEALFIRAFCYFYLSNLFGNVPLSVSTNYQVNNTLGQTSSAEILKQVISDLENAQQLLKPDYSFSNGERVRPDKWAAIALLARAYLYQQDWADAQKQASIVINYNSLFNLTSLDSVFLANSNEAIWQLEPNQQGYNTNEGLNFILFGVPQVVALSDQIVNTFENGDNRKTHWVNSYSDATGNYFYAWKYKVNTGTPVTEYSMVLRLAEQYLIRAEAYAQAGDFEGAASDLNTIRKRAGLPNTIANTKNDLLNAINHERQVELFTEWGHRWFDLKRTGNAGSVLALVKGSDWKATDTLYPIPITEIQNNTHILQNQGY